jgi:hypothetical protein
MTRLFLVRVMTYRFIMMGRNSYIADAGTGQLSLKGTNFLETSTAGNI